MRPRSILFRTYSLLAGLALALWAGGQAQATDAEGAAQLVQQTFERSISAFEEHQDEIRQNPRVAYNLIEEILAPHVDFELMSRLILARHWTEASEEQQQRFVEVFRESLLRTYSRVLSDNADDAIRELRRNENLFRIHSTEGPDRRGRVNVRTILRFDGQSIPMDYRMYQRGGEWKVFDVLIENISFVMNYRSEYDSELERGDLDGLIERLEARNRRAWAGDADEAADDA
ncbi:hypothetical protein CAI21_20095 [Alkalilimnicola ehrlichii]|uniref:Toluene tolerance family protein n=1 Tax=Alkalilimnicola ehrlichii TaxID=351052 RepID=A0A3E0X2D7_9GAMM|nr:ABC transporter substrate-binding protein [Alkalilimnicola ehrlichii]RFA25136.1 hypothetical protein CAI21_20095 [Alkalilimnicola ehrlichii]RFA38801.1 hypothetical protein CAL65_02500 [Alkalilimnicola ehrlichii]